MGKNMNTECLRQKIGNCGSCNILEIAINQVRWRGVAPDVAVREIETEYCPDGEKLSLDRVVNSSASHAMGQPRQENVSDLHDIRPLNPLSGKKIAPKNWGRWFR